jgi:protein-S-isoprenylcysteine O-methyltransferase Ste14
MSSLLAFKLLQIVITVICIYFTADFRKKRDMAPLFDRRLLLGLKLMYPMPIVIQLYTLITLDQILVTDFVSLTLTMVGTYVIARAKIDLGRYHTWTGYYSDTAEHVTSGIYAYIRHPLYAGLYLVVAGIFFTTIWHSSTAAVTVVLLTLSSTLLFITISAQRETRKLEEKFGTPFTEYRNRVHPFLPLRKFESERQD